MANFFHRLLEIVPKNVFPIFLESPFIAIPARPSTAELAEDLIVDPEALKLETHDPGVFDENGDYVPQYSDDPGDLELFEATPLTAPNGDTEPESVAPANESTENSVDESK